MMRALGLMAALAIVAALFYRWVLAPEPITIWLQADPDLDMPPERVLAEEFWYSLFERVADCE